MIDCFLHMPDDQPNAPSWKSLPQLRCNSCKYSTGSLASAGRASNYLKFCAALRSPSPSVSSDDAGPEFSDEDDWRKYEISSVEF